MGLTSIQTHSGVRRRASRVGAGFIFWTTLISGREAMKVLLNKPVAGRQNSGVWWEAAACLRPYWKLALLAVLAVAAGSAVGLLPPLLVRGLIDDALPAGRGPRTGQPLLPYVLGLVLIPLAAALIGLAQDFLCTRIGQSILSDLRNRLFRHFQSQSLRFFTATPAGEITARVSNDVAEVRWAVEDTLPEVLTSVVRLIGTMAVLLWVSWPLALAACATVPVFLLPARRAAGGRGSCPREAQEQQARLLALLSDVLNVGGYVLMRLFNQGEEAARRFGHNAELMRLRLLTGDGRG